MRSEPNCELSPSIRTTAGALLLLVSRLNTTGDVASARRALDDFPEVLSHCAAVGPRGATGPQRSIHHWLADLSRLNERRFTDAFQAV